MTSPKPSVTVDSVEISIAASTTTWLRRLKLSLFKRRASCANVVVLEGDTCSGSHYLLQNLVPADSIVDLNHLVANPARSLTDSIPASGPVGINEPSALRPQQLADLVLLTQSRDQQLVLRTQSLGTLISQLLPSLRRRSNASRLLIAHVAAGA